MSVIFPGRTEPAAYLLLSLSLSVRAKTLSKKKREPILNIGDADLSVDRKRERESCLRAFDCYVVYLCVVVGGLLYFFEYRFRILKIYKEKGGRFVDCCIRTTLLCQIFVFAGCARG